VLEAPAFGLGSSSFVPTFLQPFLNTCPRIPDRTTWQTDPAWSLAGPTPPVERLRADVQHLGQLHPAQVILGTVGGLHAPDYRHQARLGPGVHGCR